MNVRVVVRRALVSRLIVSLSALPAALTGQQPATHGELPAVSPDGSLIAFLSDRTGANNVFVIGVDGSGERQISQNNRSGRQEIWVMNADGTGVRQVMGIGSGSPKRN